MNLNVALLRTIILNRIVSRMQTPHSQENYIPVAGAEVLLF